MSQDYVAVRQPSAHLFISDGAPVAPAMIQLNIGINSIPVAEVSVFPRTRDASQQALRVSNRDFALNAGAVQERIFSNRLEPDASFTIFDGQDGVLTFKGFIASPSFGFAPGNVSNNLTLMHESAPVIGIDSSIYSYVDKAFMVPDPRITETNVASLVKALTQDLVRKWKIYRDSFIDPSAIERTIRSRTGDINDRLLPIWYKILDNSTQDMNWPELAEILEQYRVVHINGWIYQTLKGAQGNFFNNMSVLGQGFQSAFIPDLTPGQFGRFRRSDFAYDNMKRLDVASTNIQLNAGNPNILPVSRAVVQTIPKQWWLVADKNGLGNVPRPIIAAYPETPVDGTGIFRDGGPPWLDADVEVERPLSLPPERLDLNVYTQQRQELTQKTTQKLQLPMQRICAAWARDIYVMESLRSSTASLTVPLDVSLTPGDWYTVTSGDAFLFIGQLAEVHHIVGTHPRPAAFSELTFTHVEAGGFQLPYRNP